jgi:hypothetical protein
VISLRALSYPLLLAVSLFSAPAAFAAQPSAGACRLFVVVHQVSLGSGGRIASVRVDRVIDPSAPGTPEEAAQRPISMELPPGYLAAVRRFLETRTYPPEPRSFYTYTFYDPAQPERGDINPGNC